uniref:Uncharacterized protein n=1 Tax=Heterorhabditis bacteriophora TaxID=37862 RepID=A0A1I7WL68_HETBA
MPPSMLKSSNTSVRERVLAIERGQTTENSIIRARYVPDVRGVNRYKHFHVANSSSEAGRSLMGNTDKSSIASELPNLTQSIRVRSVQGYAQGTDENNGMEKPRRGKRSVLPQLGLTHFTFKPQKEKDICDYIEHQAKVALALSDSQSSTNTTRSNHSGIRLNDHLTMTSIQMQTGPRTFASLGTRQNGLIINKPSSSNLDVSMPPRSKSAHNITAEATSGEVSNVQEANTGGSVSSRATREIATQTLNKVKKSTTSVEFLDPSGKGRGTQTDLPSVGISRPRRKSEVSRSINDIEEREVLFQVIEDALGETIDRYSRIRTNQIIANSARKQAQIWRDAKDFIAMELVPKSIQLANRSRSTSKTAAEITKQSSIDIVSTND